MNRSNAFAFQVVFDSGPNGYMLAEVLRHGAVMCRVFGARKILAISRLPGGLRFNRRKRFFPAHHDGDGKLFGRPFAGRLSGCNTTLGTSC